MNEIITINSTDLIMKEYGSQRVVTLKDVNAVHQRPDGTARNANTLLRGRTSSYGRTRSPTTPGEREEDKPAWPCSRLNLIPVKF